MITTHRITTALAYALALHYATTWAGIEHNFARVGSMALGWGTLLGLALGCYTAGFLPRAATTRKR